MWPVPEGVATVRNFTIVFAIPAESRTPRPRILAGYFVLALGVTLALWQTGVLSRVPPIWIGVGVLVAIGLGIMVSVSSGKPTVSEEIQS
jgi:hypothetical protein